MLVIALDLTLEGAPSFKDTKEHWAEAEIDTLSNMGIVKGATDDSFKPDAEATRFESLIMILGC